MKNTLRVALVLACALFSHVALAASLLPNGKQTFLDANGKPLAGGKVRFYVPNTTLPKDTYQDSGATVLNTNPVALDSAGRATIYGNGAYREVVFDQYGTQIWDQLTGDVNATNASWGGTSGGIANQQTIKATNFSSQDGQVVSFIAGFTSTGPLSIIPNGGSPIGVLVDTSSGSISTTGGEVVAGNIVSLVYDALRGAFHLAQSGGGSGGIGAQTAISSAATTDLGTILSHFALVNGTTTITSFGSTCSASTPIYFVKFAAVLTITASASIVTPGSGNITTAANDNAVLQCLGNGNWQVLTYNPASNGNVPSTAVMAFAGTTCPPGWVAADGTNGTVDARGVAIRGLDNGRGFDPSGTRTVGNYQADALQSHTHSYFVSGNNNQATTGSGGALADSGLVASGTGGVSGANTSTETRMKNVALLYCQKL